MDRQRFRCWYVSSARIFMSAIGFFPFTNKDPVINDKAILWSAVRYDFMEFGEAS